MTHRITGNIAMIGAFALMMSWSATPASAQFGPNSRNGRGIVVFSNPNYGGDSATFRNDTPDLRQYSLNDKISSLEITDGSAWEICQDINYANRCQVVTGSVPNLRDIGWNDRISSLRRVNNSVRSNRGYGDYGNYGSYGNYGGAYNDGIMLFDRPNFRGSSTMVTGESTYRNNNRVGSVEVRSGAWELCDSGGRCSTVTRDVNDVSSLGLNGRIVSVRPAYNQGYDRNGRDNRNRRHQDWRR